MKSGVSAHLPLPQRQIGVTASRAPLIIGGLLATPLGASVWPLGDALAPPTTLRCEPD